MSGVFVPGLLYPILFLLIRPIMLGQRVDGHSVIVNNITFIIWLGLTAVFTRLIVGTTPNMNDTIALRAAATAKLAQVCPTG